MDWNFVFLGAPTSSVPVGGRAAGGGTWQSVTDTKRARWLSKRVDRWAAKTNDSGPAAAPPSMWKELDDKLPRSQSSTSPDTDTHNFRLFHGKFYEIRPCLPDGVTVLIRFADLILILAVYFNFVPIIVKHFYIVLEF